MNREIKFRAWDEKRKKWLTDFLISENGLNVYIGYCNDRIDCELMQYTGLKDKNGVEIYEGYICLTNNIHGYDGEEIGYVEVKYDNEECRYVISNNDFEIGFEDIYPSDIEVIGNICENPELLEE